MLGAVLHWLPSVSGGSMSPVAGGIVLLVPGVSKNVSTLITVVSPGCKVSPDGRRTGAGTIAGLYAIAGG